MPRTILHLIDTGGPGGAETIYLELVTRLDGTRWRSIAVVPSRDWLHGALEARGVTPVLLPSERAFDGAYLLRLLRLARAERAALIQTHLFTTGVYGSGVGRLARVPVVSTFHGQVDIGNHDPLRSVKLRVMNRSSNRIVFVSEALRRSTLASEHIPAGLTRVVRNGIDLSHYRPQRDRSIRAEIGLPEGAVLVGAVGNVRRPKDYANLLRAAAWLRTQSPSYHFVIAGDTRAGALYDELISLRNELGLDAYVRFLGFREDTARVLNNCDVYVLSSDREGFSLTTVQAMACGVPVVATRSGGPEEIVTHNETGLLVEPKDPEALGRAVDQLAHDEPLRARLTMAARRTVESEFSIDRMVGAYERVYDECLGNAVVERAAVSAQRVGVDATARLA